MTSYIDDGEGGKITVRTAERRERLWEWLDARPGQTFSSRDMFDEVWTGVPYAQVGIVLRTAIAHGYVVRLSRTVYWIPRHRVPLTHRHSVVESDTATEELGGSG